MKTKICFDDSDDFSEDETTTVVFEMWRPGWIELTISEPDSFITKENGKTTVAFSFTREQIAQIAEFAKYLFPEKL